MRGMLAPLSPHEEITLRRIALGFGERDRLSPRYIERLEQLQLIEEVEGVLQPTEVGLQRYAKLERPTKWTDDETASQQISRLLTGERRKLKPDA
ncbi:hypothetical protein BH11PSE3_BH11PSE3_04390 [soil metagenome]